MYKVSFTMRVNDMAKCNIWQAFFEEYVTKKDRDRGYTLRVN